MIETSISDNRFAMYKRRIKCPQHFMVRPGGQPFVMERIPSLRNIKESDAKIFNLNLWRKKKDRFGKPIPNWKDYYQPEISAGFAKDTIYNASNPICLQCRRCITK